MQAQDRKRTGAIAEEQQWLQDWLIRNEGASVNTETGARQYPTSVRTETMIPKHLGVEAERQWGMARAAEAEGHRQSAVRLYEQALRHFMEAQHNIFTDSPLKHALMSRAQECMDRLIPMASHRIERIEVPFEGNSLPALLHTSSGDDQPLLFYIPGMDGTKETSGIGPLATSLRSRGFRVFTMDGPGQGAARALRRIHLTPGSYGAAAAAALDHLQENGFWDGNDVWVLGSSMGTHWGIEFARRDSRVSGLAFIHSAFGRLDRLFYNAPPRFRRVYAYMTGRYDEDSLREAVAANELLDDFEVYCPTLIAHGEYDPLTTLAEARNVYANHLKGPKTLWVFEDAFHGSRELSALCGLNGMEVATDWLADRAQRKPVEEGEFLIPAHSGSSIYGKKPLERWQTEIGSTP